MEAAKKKIDPKKLKHDPTKNLEKPPEGFNRNRVADPDEEGSDDDDDEDDYDSDFDEGGFYVRDSDEDEDDGGWGGYRPQDYLGFLM